MIKKIALFTIASLLVSGIYIPRISASSQKITGVSRIWSIDINNGRIVWSNRPKGMKRNVISTYNLSNGSITTINKGSTPFDPIICGTKIYYWQINSSSRSELISYRLANKSKTRILTASLASIKAKCAGNIIAYSDDKKLYTYHTSTKIKTLISSNLDWYNRNWDLFDISSSYLVYSESDNRGNLGNLIAYNLKTKKKSTLVSSYSVYEFTVYRSSIVYHEKLGKHILSALNILTKKKTPLKRFSSYPYLQDYSGSLAVYATYKNNSKRSSGRLFSVNTKTKKISTITPTAFNSQLSYPAKQYKNYIVWNAIVNHKSGIYIKKLW